jgi:hypothetical protein
MGDEGTAGGPAGGATALPKGLLCMAIAGILLAIAGATSLSLLFLSSHDHEYYAKRTRCQSHLREINYLGRMYVEMGHHDRYPWSEKGGIESLQVIADENEGLRPDLFICPASPYVPSEPGADGKFRLDAEHSSYEMVPWRLSPGDPEDALVAFDREPWHAGGRDVVFLDNSAEFLTEAEFGKKLEADRKRFAGRKADRP